MNAHVLMVLYAGMTFIGSGASLLEIGRLLGKSFETKISASWWIRGPVYVGAGVLFAYGCILLFPGKAIQTQHMSIGLPLVGTVMLGMALWLLDIVTGEREPPPWSVDFLRLAALIGRENVIKGVAFRTAPAAYRDPLPPETPSAGRLVRVAVILGAIFVIVAVSAIILSNSARG